MYYLSDCGNDILTSHRFCCLQILPECCEPQHVATVAGLLTSVVLLSCVVSTQGA